MPVRRWVRFDLWFGLCLLGLCAVQFRLHGSYDRGGFVEEAIPFRQALTLWGWGDNPPTANPNFFNYPSLSIYVQWLAQGVATATGLATRRYGTASDAGVEFMLDPSFLVAFARAAMLGCVWLAGWAGYCWWRERDRRLGTSVGVAICLSPMLVRAWFQMPPEVMMAPILPWLAMVSVEPSKPRWRSDLWAGAVAGALLSIKYSALPLVLFCALFRAAGATSTQASVNACIRVLAAAAVVALVGTPFAMLDFPAFVQAVGFEWSHLVGGHLGASHLDTGSAHGRQLLAAFGVVPVVATFALALTRETRTRHTAFLFGALLMILVPAFTAVSGGPERYLVPIVPLTWVFVSEVGFLAFTIPRRAARAIGIAVFALAAMQIVLLANQVLRLSGSSPSAQAGLWLREHARADAIVAQDHGATAVFTSERRAELLRSRALKSASLPWLERARSSVGMTVVDLPMVTAGSLEAMVPGPSGVSRAIPVVVPGWKLAPHMYDLLRAVPVDYFVANLGLERRVERALGLPQGSLLERAGLGPVVAVCRDTKGSVFSQPDIVLRSGPRFVAQLSSTWWMGDETPTRPDARSVVDPGDLVAARRVVYRAKIMPALKALALARADRGEFEDLLGPTRLMVLSDPEDLLAIRLALLALEANTGQAISARETSQVLVPIAGERNDRWRARVLREWGVVADVAEAESQRFSRWRESSHAAPHLMQ